MAIDPNRVGAKAEPIEAFWSSKDCLLYAVGVGAGLDELQFTTENTEGVSQQVLPTFPVVAAQNVPKEGFGVMELVGEFNPAMLVHGSQSVTIHKPIPVDGRARLETRIKAIYDKTKACVVVSETTATDLADGKPLYSSESAAFIRGEGGWGGDRGPSGPQNVPPDRAPDHVVNYATLKEQALIYRLSGDRNPLHSDPAFAAAGGFNEPILHGLCTYGFTGRALLHSLCGGDAHRFKHIEGRFASPVIAGEHLTIRIWETAGGEAVFTTSVGDRLVIDQGLVRFS